MCCAAAALRKYLSKQLLEQAPAFVTNALLALRFKRGWHFPVSPPTVFFGQDRDGCAEGRDGPEHRCEAHCYVFAREVEESAGVQLPAPHHTTDILL
jgi:hypothetical protein